ncbi:Lrp/AsnC family transcriptional regulator [Leisingera aquaemixtae]|uniref:Lrp/AsnC family transcriptional regulator n=1 Tax=Leisingera aquaemixtae TaxID=1396826 RepID=UPI0021A6C541|nr:Lrp/AsnC family transcriptional regulator [Leisingera aquaemixtae]UWQ44257.1 Lrp/AsnC family transcriptional regulator [Leisingera aquaemixtae]
MAEEKTDGVRKTAGTPRALDALDRKILGALSRDATLSYAAIGQDVGLSAPAVHERVKRLRASGTIEATVARLDGAAVGKPLLAFIHVDTEGWGVTTGLLALQEMPELEEVHSSAGDTNLILKVRVASPKALEGLLARIYEVGCVRATRTYTVLSTHLDRPVQAGTTEDLADGGPVK